MRRFFNGLVKFWWIWPIISIGCSLGVLIISPDSDYGPLFFVLTCIAAVALAIQFVLLVVTLFMKKWKTAILECLLGVPSLIAFLVFPGFFLLMILLAIFDSQPDGFGGKHPIPEGLEYSIPLGYISTDSMDTISFGDFESRSSNANKPIEPIIDSLVSQTWLQIWNGVQGGIYYCDFYYPALPNGKVYLRCFEVTTNTELSSDRVRKCTETHVIGHTSFGKIINSREFTIYEGDWEDYYAVRVEVWFHDSLHKNRPDRKIGERIYRMEGWMR